MSKKNKIVLLLLFFAIKISTSFAQVDTVFWFAAPWVTPDHHWRDEIKLHVSTFAVPSTTVRVWQPAAIAPNQYDTTFTVPANSTFNFTFLHDRLASPTNTGYDSLETRPANQVVPYGLKIMSSSNITVVYDEITRAPDFLNPETFSLKGQNALGTEFICPFQTKWRNQTLGSDINGDGVITQPKQQINVVATMSNTVIWITPKCPVVGHPANVTYSVLLVHPGDAYTVENLSQATTTPGQNLSGTIIVSNHPIAVTVADDSVSGVTGCYDLMGDQIVPVDIVGKDYIVVKGAMNAPEPEGAFIVGTENFTHVTINDGVITNTLINKGDTYHYKTTNLLTSVTTDKNVYVLQATGFGCELGEAILPPLSCAGSSLVAFSRNNDQPFRLNILCKSGAENTFTLNGSPTAIPGSSFFPVPGTGGLYMGAQIPYSITDIPVGSYTVGNSTDVFALGIFNGNTTTGGLYHYMSSFLRKTTATTGTITPVCASPQASVALTGTISGAAITGVWSVGSATAVPLPGPYTSSVNVIAINYNLTSADTLQDTLYFYLRSTGACKTETAVLKVKVNQRPKVFLGSASNITMCKNNVLPVSLTGNVSNALGAIWVGGNGGVFGPQGTATTYTPSQADLVANTITLSLVSQGPQPGCANSSKSLTVTFTDPPIVNVGPVPFVCTNSSTMQLGGYITGITNAGVWSTSGTGLFFPNNASPTATYQLSASDVTQAQLTFTLTSIYNSTNNPGGCQAESDVLILNVTPKPLVTVPANFSVCASDLSVSLNGNVSGSASQGVWSTTVGTGGFTQLPPAGATYTLSQNDTLTGYVVFDLTSTGGMCPEETSSFTVSIEKTIYAIISTTTPIVCDNARIFLSGGFSGPISTYTWLTSGTGSFTPNNTVLNPQYHPSPSDIINSVTLTLDFINPSGCGAKADIFVPTFAHAPQALFATVPATPCLGANILLSNTSNNNGTYDMAYNWDFGTNSPTGISSYSSPVTSYSNSGYYVATLTVTGTSSLVSAGTVYTVSCPDVVTNTIEIFPLPVPDFSITNACQNLPTKFTNLSYSPLGTARIDTLFWTFGAGASFTLAPPTPTIGYTYSVSSSNEARLEVSTANGCRAVIRKIININPQPKAEFGMTNNPSVVEEPVYFSDFTTPKGNIVQWEWEFGDYGASRDSTPVHNYQDAGIYTITLTVTDNNGCRDTLSKNIEVTLLPQVPTAFTPNNDGNNDLLFVKGGPFAVLTFKVYNSWGEMVFETRDQTLGWDGKKNGIDQPVGVYIWTLVVDMYNNRQVKKNGDITLIR